MFEISLKEIKKDKNSFPTIKSKFPLSYFYLSSYLADFKNPSFKYEAIPRFDAAHIGQWCH
jgi:hypothetical protein